MEYSESESDVSSVLGYSVENANDIIEEISDHFKDILDTVKCKRVLDLQGEMFKKPNKDKCAEWIIELCDTLRRSRMLFLGVSRHIDELQREVIRNQKVTIELQNEVIKCKEVQINGMQQSVQSEIENLKSEVKDTFHSEMKSYSEVVKKSANSAADLVPENIQKMMKKVVADDDRSKNLMVFGLEESDDETLRESAIDVLATLDEKPKLESVRRIGVSRSGYRRPVKIAFGNSEIVRQILIKSSKLKNMDKYKSVFLAPDRCPEERIKHRELVVKLKERRTEDNSQRFVIRGGQIVNI